MLKTTKTIKFTFSNGQWQYESKPYKVYIKNDNGWVAVYNGLTFFDENGITEIYVDSILRDIVWRWYSFYKNEEQKYLPINFVDNAEYIATPIERNNTFLTTFVKVKVDNTLEKIEEVSGAFLMFNEKENFKLINPYNETITPTHQNITLYSKVPPTIPNIDTNNFWLGLIYSANYQMRDYPLFLKTPTNALQLKRDGYGNFAEAFSLSFLKNKLNIKNDSNILLSKDPNLLVKGDSLVAKIDKCTKPFYVAFVQNFNWNCFGFDGNTTTKIIQKNDAIKNVGEEDEVIWNRTRTIFNLNTDIISFDEYYTLMSIVGAYKIYVYDTKRDKGVFCTLSNESFTDCGNKYKKMKHFNLELIENKDQIA